MAAAMSIGAQWLVRYGRCPIAFALQYGWCPVGDAPQCGWWHVVPHGLCRMIADLWLAPYRALQYSWIEAPWPAPYGWGCMVPYGWNPLVEAPRCPMVGAQWPAVHGLRAGSARPHCSGYVY